MNFYREYATGNKGLIDNTFIKYKTIRDEYNEIRVLEPLITFDMFKLANELKTNFIGTEYSVKTASSIEDKLDRIEEEIKEENKNKPFYEQIMFNPEDRLLELKDVIRYTEICDHDDIFEIASKTTKYLESCGYIKSGHKNYYLKPYPETKYQGLHLNFITPYGQEIELQVHSKESFIAKQRGHDAYSIVRSVSASKEQKDKCSKEMINIHKSVSKPKNYENMEYEFKLENKNEIIKERKFNTNIKYYFMQDNKTTASTYSVSLNGENLLIGFENHYSDGSATSYQNNIKEGFAKYISVTHDGKEIETYNAKQKEYTLEQAMSIAMYTENMHKEYMQNNFKNAEKERLNIENEIAYHSQIIERN